MFGYNQAMARKIHDWEAVQRYFDEGHGFAECRQRFGFTYAAWAKAIKRERLSIGVSSSRDRRLQYDWEAVQAYYDQGHTYRECRERFGFAAAAWTKAVKRGSVKPRPRVKSIETVLTSRSSTWAKKLKLLREGLLRDECYECGIRSWQGRPLAIQIDHINGSPHDWRLENLRMLCPNCHSQTPTFSGKNLRRRKCLQELPPVM
jgi:hypothetical protein